MKSLDFKFLIFFIDLLWIAAKEANGIHDSNVLICHVTSNSVYIANPGKFSPDFLDPTLCTHIVYSSPNVNPTFSGIQSTEGQPGKGEGLLKDIVQLKEKNPSLRVLIYIGGMPDVAVVLSEVASSEQKRQVFAQGVLDYIRVNDLDGLTIYWEHPGIPPSRAEDKQKFPKLLEALSHQLSPFGHQVIVEIRVRNYIIDAGYDIPKIFKAVDFGILRLFNLIAFSHNVSLPSSPLRSSNKLSVESGMDLILQKGADRHKLILGLATYGNMYKAWYDVPEGMYVMVPATNEGTSPWTKNKHIGYNEVCSFLLTPSEKWREYWDQESMTPFAVKDRVIITYENGRSFLEKAKAMKERGLIGISIERLENDDFKGYCHSSRYPLVKEIKKFLEQNGGIQPNLLSIKVGNHFW